MIVGFYVGSPRPLLHTAIPIWTHGNFPDKSDFSAQQVLIFHYAQEWETERTRTTPFQPADFHNDDSVQSLLRLPQQKRGRAASLVMKNVWFF